MSLETVLERIAVALEAVALQGSKGAKLSDHVHVETPDADPPAATRGRPRLSPEGQAAKPNGAAGKASAADEDGLGGAKTLTFEEIRGALVGVKVKHGPEVSRGIMKKFGATAVTELKVESYPQVYKACEAAMA